MPILFKWLITRFHADLRAPRPSSSPSPHVEIDDVEACEVVDSVMIKHSYAVVNKIKGAGCATGYDRACQFKGPHPGNFQYKQGFDGKNGFKLARQPSPPVAKQTLLPTCPTTILGRWVLLKASTCV